MSINFPEGQQDFPGVVVQVKGYMTSAATQTTTSDYIWGGGNNGADAENGRIQFTPLDTSNQLILISSISLGDSNFNGGLQWRINGSNSNSFYKANTTNTYAGGSTSYTGAWATPDDGASSNTAYDIGFNTVSLVTQSSYTLPSSIDFGLYYAMSTNSGEINFNRQDQDNNGRAVSSLVIYEVKSA